MAYSAPFACTWEGSMPPWVAEDEPKSWTLSKRNGRNMSDISLDGAGFHSGYMNYDGAGDTHRRVCRRLSMQRSGLTGSIRHPRQRDPGAAERGPEDDSR